MSSNFENLSVNVWLEEIEVVRQDHVRDFMKQLLLFVTFVEGVCQIVLFVRTDVQRRVLWSERNKRLPLRRRGKLVIEVSLYKDEVSKELTSTCGLISIESSVCNLELLNLDINLNRRSPTSIDANCNNVYAEKVADG